MTSAPLPPPILITPASGYEVVRPASDPRDGVSVGGTGMHLGDAAPHPDDPLAERRSALRERYRWALTADEALVHRRLLNAGRVAEARALIEQAERFYLTARRTLALMNADELEAFGQAVDFDDGPRRYRVVASTLRRVGREATWRAAEAPVLTTGMGDTTV